ncbi:MAG: hypothetical protein IMY70_06835 [Bacteroidetes bacterium]|nr:hypothetical protein [Bacteroidota bacterium]
MNNKYIRLSIVPFLLSVIFLISCAGGTKITGSWSNKEDTPVKFDKIAVIGITSKASTRKVIENDIATKLNEKGYNAVAGLQFLPPNASKENLSKEILLEFLKVNNFDGVIGVSVLSAEKHTTKISGGYYWIPKYDVPLSDYYGQMSNYVYSPGYYTNTEIFFLECNLYTFPKGELIWSVQTETVSLETLYQTIANYANIVVRDLLKKKVLEKQ